MKILDKLVELDVIDLQFIQDFPYLYKYHEDLEREFKELDEDIKQLGEKIDDAKKPTKPINPIFKTAHPDRIPIESITKDKEIQEILMSRTQSGFERRIQKK